MGEMHTAHLEVPFCHSIIIAIYIYEEVRAAIQRHTYAHHLTATVEHFMFLKR